MDVVITLTFDNPVEYKNWLRDQTQSALQPAPVTAEMAAVELAMPEEARATSEDASSPITPEERTAAAEKIAPKKRRGRKARTAEKEAAPVKTTIIPKKEEVLPTAPPATEAAPAEGEKTYTLADSREVLTAYLAKPGNGAESLLKELKKHDAKRINEVPSQHIHGFLKRMVEAS